jgi:C_GCAxxG_C_C family probable redox protein
MNAKDFTLKNYDLNCSETMVHYGNKLYDLKLSSKALESMAGFGGGIFEGDICGVVTGGVAVISMVIGKKSPYLQDAVIAFKKRIKDAFQSIECHQIKPVYRDELTGCKNVIIQSLEIMEDVIKDFSNL